MDVLYLKIILTLNSYRRQDIALTAITIFCKPYWQNNNIRIRNHNLYYLYFHEKYSLDKLLNLLYY